MHYFYPDSALERRLDRVERALNLLLRRIDKMSVAMDRLIASVARNAEVSESIIELVHGLAQQIRDNATDPVKLNALADEIDRMSDEEAEAVLANTPQEEPDSPDSP